MSKIFEVKTIKDGQHDLFRIEGDFLECEDSTQMRIYKIGDTDPEIVAAFCDWVYGIEMPVQKSPE